MTKGTILYMGNFELPDKNASAHRVMNNAKIFRALGFRVVFLGVVRNERFDGIRRSSFDVDIYEEAYPASSAEWFRHIYDTKNIEALAKQFDDVRMIVVYNIPYAALKAVNKAFRRTSVTVAYDCTEWNRYAEGSFLKRLYKRIDGFETEHFLSKKCRNIIVISSMMERQYRTANLLRLPPLVDIDEPLWRQQREEHEGIFEFCFAGTVSNKESLDKVVEAFCSIGDPALRLRIVGMDREEYLHLYPSQEAAVRADDRLIFTGYVTHRQAVRYTLSCDCYIFIRESTKRNNAGFPTKFAEAYTCGVPVIATDVSDIGQYISTKKDGVLLDDTAVKNIKQTMEAAAVNAGRTGRKLNGAFDYRNYIGETEAWLSRVYWSNSKT